MRVFIVKNYEELGVQAAQIVSGQIYVKPNSILGLATGSTPLSMYRHLVNIYQEYGLDFSEVTTFNLDEYVGLPEDDKNSYHYYMYNHLFRHVNLDRMKIHLPDGMAVNIDEECLAYEKAIQDCGGIDLQVLGIGQNGHIGFNEPDEKFEAYTHEVKLKQDTIEANARFFDDVSEVPTRAVSMGIKTIMQAKKVVLLANGSNKAEAVYRAVCESITPTNPASILQLHQDVIVIIEEGAATYLRDRLTLQQKERILFFNKIHECNGIIAS